MIIMVACFQYQSLAQLPPGDQAYKMVFHDEFDRIYGKTIINGNLWLPVPPWNQKSNYTGNVSRCYPGDTTSKHWDRAYINRDWKDTSAIKVINGTCKIITNKRDYWGQVYNWPPCNPDKPGYSTTNKKCMNGCALNGVDSILRCWTIDTLPFKYTTGMLFSKQKFRRGYFELRFRLPAAPDPPGNHQGFGPNFWLWGNNPPHNWYSEIDIFEIIALNGLQADTNKYTSTVHYSQYNTIKRKQVHTEVIGNKLKGDTTWHKAAAWWTDEFIKFYLDDSLYYTVQGLKEISIEKLAEMNLIIDVNAPVSGRCNNFDELNTQFPYVYEIDYVRVYQLR